MERFGIDLSAQILKELLRQIRKSESVVVFRQSNRIVHHRVKIGEEMAIAVYDKNRGTIVTFLTEDMDPRRLAEFGSEDVTAWWMMNPSLEPQRLDVPRKRRAWAQDNFLG